MVVISIISLLSSVVLAAVGDARNKAKYTKFDTEFLQLKTAVELYRLNNNGNYPPLVYEENNTGSVGDLVLYLNNQGYFGVSLISLPKGYTLGDNIYPANPNAPTDTGSTGGGYSNLWPF